MAVIAGGGTNARQTPPFCWGSAGRGELFLLPLFYSTKMTLLKKSTVNVMQVRFADAGSAGGGHNVAAHSKSSFCYLLVQVL